MKTKCPVCNGEIIEISETDANPFDKNRKTVRVCSLCGRIFSTDANCIDSNNTNERLNPSKLAIGRLKKAEQKVQTVIKVRAEAVGGGKTLTAQCILPYEDGKYALGNEYPFGRSSDDFKFDSIIINGDELTLAGETVNVLSLPYVITRKLTAYGYDKCPQEETLTITVSADIKTV